MTQVLEAVYENGMFRPTTRPSLTEGQQVRLIIEAEARDDILALAARVYAGLAEKDVNDVEYVALDRSTFFARPQE